MYPAHSRYTVLKTIINLRVEIHDQLLRVYSILSEQGLGCLELRHFAVKNDCDLTLFFS